MAQRPDQMNGARAGRVRPGARLLAAAALVRPGRVLADIGTDHGQLPVYLVLGGQAPRAIAVDSRPAPLARASRLAASCGIADRVDCRLGDGLAALQPGEAEEIVIAGLSGETIAGIIEKAPWLRDGRYHLVLQPATRAPRLRRYLCAGGFAILQEAPVEDKGRAYTTLSVEYTGEVCAREAWFYEVGLLPQAGGPAAAMLLQSRLADLRKQALAPLEDARRAALHEQIQEVERCLKSMK